MEVYQKGGEFTQNSKNTFNLSSISIVLNYYEDIFSTFDARPYSEKSLSDDFLQEIKRAARDKPSGGLDLRFLMHAHDRNLGHEHLIKRRLKEHFRKHSLRMRKEYMSFFKMGIFLSILGITMMISAAFFNLYPIFKNPFSNQMLFIFLEPGGWFFAWRGLDTIFSNRSQNKKEKDFYTKMENCDIHFLSY